VLLMEPVNAASAGQGVIVPNKAPSQHLQRKFASRGAAVLHQALSLPANLVISVAGVLQQREGCLQDLQLHCVITAALNLQHRRASACGGAVQVCQCVVTALQVPSGALGRCCRYAMASAATASAASHSPFEMAIQDLLPRSHLTSTGR
jgi:hypothetical protein